MYNIDINFLKDRQLDALNTATAIKKKADAPLEAKLPVLIGSGVAVVLIAITGGALLLLNNQKSGQSDAIAQLDQEIQRLQGQNQQVQQIQQQIDNINREIGILVSVFDQLKPWSAMLSEIASVTPSNIQIRSINQADRTLTINGYADSYERVNDLFLTLKNSPLLDAQATKLTSSTLVDNPSTVIFDRAQLYEEKITPSSNADITVELPQVVLYTITTAITDESSQKYLNELNRQGAIGLVSRLTSLQRRGVLNQNLPKPEENITEGEIQQ